MVEEAPWYWTDEMQEDYDKIIRHCGETIDIGKGLEGNWMKLAYEKPPEDFLGRIFWTLRIIFQLLISKFTFAAAIGAFFADKLFNALKQQIPVRR